MGGGFFSGSLFDSALPLPRQPLSPARQPRMTTWHPFSSPEPVGGGNLGWLDQMVGPKPASTAPSGLPSTFPLAPVSTSSGQPPSPDLGACKEAGILQLACIECKGESVRLSFRGGMQGGRSFPGRWRR